MSVNGQLPSFGKTSITFRSTIKSLVIAGMTLIVGAFIVGASAAFAWWAFNGVCGRLGC